MLTNSKDCYIIELQNTKREVKTVLTITETKNEATTIIEMLKQLPKEKQEFVNGYIQGVADTIAEQKESA